MNPKCVDLTKEVDALSNEINKKDFDKTTINNLIEKINNNINTNEYCNSTLFLFNNPNINNHDPKYIVNLIIERYRLRKKITGLQC
jgi:transcriptional regulator CtsR